MEDGGGVLFSFHWRKCLARKELGSAQEKVRRVGRWDGRRAQARYLGPRNKADQPAIRQKRPLEANAS
jgi:hypothetical protein